MDDARIDSRVIALYPPIRSFRRRGRMTPARKRRWAEFAPRFCIAMADLDVWRPTHLDIGFGSGESVLATARDYPGARVLGVEVHEAGLTHLMSALADSDIENVRVIRHDIVEVMPSLRQGSLSEISIFFPDPWPKAAHARRRLVRAEVVELLVDRLAPGGVLRLATDADHYARQMRDVCDANVRLENVEPPRRVTTKYERLGREAGRTITDLGYRRLPAR